MKKVYTRPRALKRNNFHYCPGCGHSVIHRVIAEIIDEMNLQNRIIGVPPCGCSVYAYDYLDIDMLEAAHGRGSAVATGIKRAFPEIIVFSYQGDGDLAAIGTAETIHAANRGEKITVIFVNNAVYGMTGGQMAPTTLLNQSTSVGHCPNDLNNEYESLLLNPEFKNKIFFIDEGLIENIFLASCCFNDGLLLGLVFDNPSFVTTFFVSYGQSFSSLII